MDNPEATTDSTLTDDSVPMDTSQTEEALLADIIRNSDFVDTLPDEQVPQLDAEDSDEEDPDTLDEADNVDDDNEEETDEEETTDADDESTQEADVYTTDDLDLEAQVLVKIDGEEVAVSFSDLIKGYSTEQHLSNKGRELGDARKEMEAEFNDKAGQIQAMSQASAAVLYSAEQSYSKEYHDIEAKIQTARDEGDTYEVNELKDKREQVQKQYWEARNQREGMVEAVQKQAEEQTAKAWQEQLNHFQETIPTMIPDFNEETALAIREFAEGEGISSELLDTVVDPTIVKFVDDYRRLKQGVTKGQAKRKTTTVKKAPIKKAKTRTQKQVDEAERVRQRALSEDSSNEDQMAFLRSMANRSLNL
jgi:FtsZ-binding cell division protein ZapB